MTMSNMSLDSARAPARKMVRERRSVRRRMREEESAEGAVGKLRLR